METSCPVVSAVFATWKVGLAVSPSAFSQTDEKLITAPPCASEREAEASCKVKNK